MCILCVIQKWSRRIATMLPWLVIPLIGLWLLSQFLPPAFRFEITSPRLACVFVLLVTLFWYEILMPRLSAWRVHRNARLRERKRFEAIEMQKLRKTATRKCRNCLTPYRDQNPGGGRFMCSYCGHISKRPVLDLHVPPGLGFSDSGTLKDLVGKGGKMFNRKVWSDNGWICNQEWLDSGSWNGGSFSGKSNYWWKNSSGVYGGEDRCFTENSYSRLVIFVCRGFATFCMGILWLWRRIVGSGSSEEDASLDAENRGLVRGSENGLNFNESRSEKARRKAEEKRLARLEKEQLEEEERKQREEVARLVEERRKLRDEKAEAERERGKFSPREKNSKKEAEKKRMERKKDKDKGSSKSNSDVDELEKKTAKETERNRKIDVDQNEQIKSGAEALRLTSNEISHGSKGSTANNHGRGNVGSRYLDRMRGSFLSSSRAFTGGGFFGKGANSTATVPRENRFFSSSDQVQNSANKRELSQTEHLNGKLNIVADDRKISRPVLIDTQTHPVPKKSWQQLFTRSPASSPPTCGTVISRPNGKMHSEVQSPPLSSYQPATHQYENPLNFGLPSPFALSAFPYGTASRGPLLSTDSMVPTIGEAPHILLPEEPDIFEDPCYVPDPVSLIGPISESLDNFQSDFGFVPELNYENPGILKTMPVSSEATRPSPIGSPMSRLRVADEMHVGSFLFPGAPRPQEIHNLPKGDQVNANDNGTWQMWGTSPIGPDSLGFMGAAPNWNLPPDPFMPNAEDAVARTPYKTMASLFKKADEAFSDSHGSQKLVQGCFQNGGTYSSLVHSAADDHWMPKTSYGLPLNLEEGAAQNELAFRSPSGPATSHPFKLSQGNIWAKSAPSSIEGIGGDASATKSPVGGLYSSPDVQSIWSYD